MSQLAHAAGAVIVAAVVTPFDFEEVARNRTAEAAISHLHRYADLVMAFSNEQCANRYTGDAPLLDAFDALNGHTAFSVPAGVSRLVTPRNCVSATFDADCQSV